MEPRELLACTHITVFKLEEKISYHQYKDHDNELRAIMEKVPELIDKYVKAKKLTNIVKTQLAKEVNDFKAKPRKRSRTSLTYRFK